MSVRFFNTAGPCIDGRHYMLPPIDRLPDALELIDEGMYFVVHAPRQTGKTTTLMALAKKLTASGQYAGLYLSCESAEAVGDDYGAAQKAILDSIRREAEDELPAALRPPQPWPDVHDSSLLSNGLRAWTHACPRPLVLFFDEIDAVRGQSLIAVLRQLRSMYRKRPDNAPWSVVLCGLRDVRDYKAAGGGDIARLGSASPFNIKVESMRLGDFSADEIAALYRQHTADTGQPFTDDALAHAFALTRGQPWLVNALAREITRKMKILAPAAITAQHMDTAKERLILARATHLDSLVARLQEDRVRRIIEPVMAGNATLAGDSYNDDVAYVRDLGLIAQARPLQVANPIYREVIARVLASMVEDVITVAPARFIAADGRIDMNLVLQAFADFWRQNGGALVGSLPYHEVAPQLVLMAWLQSIVNGTGFIDREYGIGRGRIDLCLRWPYVGPEGDPLWQREAIELKVWRDKERDPPDDGLSQLDGYLDGLGLQHGILIIFDRRVDHRERQRHNTQTVPAAISLDEAQTPSGRAVTLLRA